jgi:hypothetical protein
LQQAIEVERRALEVEKKQVEGESPLCSLFRCSSLGVRYPFDFFCSRRPGLLTVLGHATNRAETLQAAYNSSEQELV